MDATRKTLRILRPVREDAFPLVELEAAAPCRLAGDDALLIPKGLTPDATRVWAGELSRELSGHPWSLRAVEGDGPWTHHLRLEVEGGGFRDFAVAARGLPADELEARAQGYEWVEVETFLGSPPGEALN